MEGTSTSSSAPEEITYSRAFLRTLHEKPMKEAWSRHVSGAVEFIKSKVLSDALAGYTARDFSDFVDALPTADEVLQAIDACKPKAASSGSSSSYGAPETWKSSGKLDLKTGLLFASSSSGRTALLFSGRCMDAIVSALKLVFPDSDIAFNKAAPSSGGKDVLSIRWD